MRRTTAKERRSVGRSGAWILEHLGGNWIIGMLLVASVVAMVTHRIGMPYSVGLVLAGIGLAILPIGFVAPLTPDLIFFIFLPPLVFEAAIQIPWQPFRRELPLLLALVTVGVALAAVVVAVGMHWVVGWSWIGAGLFGVLIAATDPVSVIAMMKQVAVPKRLHLLVESESLLNDGVAAVAFAVLVAISAGAGASVPEIGVELVTVIVGGVVMGAAVALPLVWIAGRTRDRLVEVTLTTTIAFGSFWAAEHIHVSGVLATLTAGLIVGNYGFLGSFATENRSAMVGFWDFAAFLVNSFVFLLIGGSEAGMDVGAVLGIAAFAFILSLLGRALAVYPLSALFRRTGLWVPAKYQHVLVWGGLRGALALALALALPATIPERVEIITVAFVVVAASIFLQGLTVPRLIAALGLIQGKPDDQGTSTVSSAIGASSGQSSV